MDERDPFDRLLRDLTPDPVERALLQIEADTALAEVICRHRGTPDLVCRQTRARRRAIVGERIFDHRGRVLAEHIGHAACLILAGVICACAPTYDPEPEPNPDPRPVVESLRRAYNARIYTTDPTEPFAFRALFDGLAWFVLDDLEPGSVSLFRGRFGSEEAANSFCERVEQAGISSPTDEEWSGSACRVDQAMELVGSLANHTDDSYEARAWCRVRGNDSLIEYERSLLFGRKDQTVEEARRGLSYPDGVSIYNAPLFQPLVINAGRRVEIWVMSLFDACLVYTPDGKLTDLDKEGVIEIDFSLRR
jgi:hypothetical protein